ncbi:MAG: TraR/DksA C4-type zinc finger protein [Methylophilus sp.]|nr:TraR/DksA C4-type zinc finger protein [Methylophilus sp.]
MTIITKNQIDSLQKIMELQLSRLVHETQEEMDPELKESINDIDGGAADVDDEAVADTMVDIDNAVIGLHLLEINELNEALDRIKASVYGICTDCDDNIDFERLTANPSAKRCIKCQSNYEKMFPSRPTSRL